MLDENTKIDEAINLMDKEMWSKNQLKVQREE